MPPVLQITIVAIDEASATRLQNGAIAPTVIESALKGSGAGLFQQTSRYTADMTTLENALIAAKIHYQVLTTSVALRESNWSSGQ